MDKLKAKLESLSQDRRYMFFVGIAIIFNGFIAAIIPFFGILIGLILGPFCLLVGYYGGDVKKGMKEFQKDVMDVKNAAEEAANKSADMAKEATAKATEAAGKAADVAKDAAGKAEAGAKKATSTVKKTAAPTKKPAEKK